MAVKVYIVILNYNGTSDTIECLESVLKSDYENYQIIVIDNSETDIPVQDLIRWAKGDLVLQKSLLPELVFPLEVKPVNYRFLQEEDLLNDRWEEKVLFVKANENKGFASGNNIALKYILQFGLRDSYVWLLNNDTVIKKNALSLIVDQMNKETKKEMIFGTPLLEYYSPKMIQAIGGIYNKRTGLTSHFGEGKSMENDDFEIDNSKTDYPVGASMIISRSFLENLGLLCEDYFLFFEELDWSFRVRKLGGEIKILNYFGVYHKQGNTTQMKTKSFQMKSELIDLLFLKNRILITEKFNKENVLFVKGYILTVTLGKRLLQGNFRIIPKIAKLVFKK